MRYVLVGYSVVGDERQSKDVDGMMAVNGLQHTKSTQTTLQESLKMDKTKKQKQNEMIMRCKQGQKASQHKNTNFRRDDFVGQVDATPRKCT